MLFIFKRYTLLKIKYTMSQRTQFSLLEIFMSATNLSFGQIISYLLALSEKVIKSANITYPSQEGTVFCSYPCSVCRKESTAAFLHPYQQRELKTRETPVRQTDSGQTVLYISNAT